MNHHDVSVGAIGAGLLFGGLLLGAAAHSQQDPPCLLPFAATGDPNPEPELVRYLWGGEMRHVFTLQLGAVHHTWVVGDGGILRHRVGNGPFEVQRTPAGQDHSLHDVFFLPDGSKGWACGNGGRVLETADLGATWTLLPQVLPDCFGSPATIWRVRFIDGNRGYVCGLGMFCFTADGGQHWAPVALDTAHAGAFEFYALELLGTPAGWIGVAAGQEWSGHCFSGPPAGLGRIFRVDTNDVAAAWGDTTVLLPAGITMCEDPWDIEFEPNPANPHTATGYLAGGTGSASGMILRTTDGGATWAYETGPVLPPGQSQVDTLYGIAVRSATEAVAVGYQGDIWWRDAGGVWRSRKYKDPVTGVAFTGPLGDAHWTRDASPTCIIAGSWGFLRARSDFALLNPPTGTWTDLDPHGAATNDEQWRLFDLAFRSDLDGYAVGQLLELAYTSDGGCTWTQVPGIASGSGDASLAAVDINNATKYAVAVGGHDTHGNNLYYNENANTLPADWHRSSLGAFAGDVDLVDVDFLTGKEAWAIGVQSPAPGGNPHVLLRSTDGGRNWDVHAMPFAGDFVANALVGIGGREGIVVGQATATGLPQAYELTYAAGAWIVRDVICPPQLRGSLTDVDGRGDSLAACDVLAVGGDDDKAPGSPEGAGYVLHYVQMPGAPAAMFDVEPLSEPIDVKCTSIAMAGGGFTLVGLRQRPDARFADDLGKVLVRSNGVNPTWTVARSRTNKTVRGICVRSNLRAWLIAKSQGEDISAEWATVNDCGILLWDPQ